MLFLYSTRIIRVTDKGIPGEGPPSSRTSGIRPSREGLEHGPVELVDPDASEHLHSPSPASSTPAKRSLRAILTSRRDGWLTYVKTREFCKRDPR